MPFVADLPADWEGWLAGEGLAAGTPFLISPAYEFDVVLNGYFSQSSMLGAAGKTREAHARDLAGFLSFLWAARDGKGWRDAVEADHLAYLAWRRRDPLGPRVTGATWDREVATVNQFYRWAVRAGHVPVNPIPQVRRRPSPVESGWAGRGSQDEQRPATYSHDAVRDKVEWLPPESYRRWRETGIRGFDAAGLPVPAFRGRWAARNASFCDLMVRTGLRLSEQAALTVFEVPVDRAGGGYRRFWLPNSISKGGSGRWVYVPVCVLGDLTDYTDVDRRAVIAQAQADGRYHRWPRPMMIAGNPTRPVVSRLVGGLRRRVKIADLDPLERTRVLVEGPDGLEPAAFWLGEHGEPLSLSAWKAMFRDANSRCAAAGVAVRCHAHLLRHTFAVVTLEQLQRGHIAALGELTVDQRGHYTRVFGDPLDWVRRRLGHRSVVTTQIYLHALAELEMQTRMMLVPDDWDDPRDDGPADEQPAGRSGAE